MRFHGSGAALGIFIGVCYAVIFPAQYQASCAVETSTVAGLAVESPLVLAEKTRLPSYFSNATQSLCAADSNSHDSGTLNAVLKTTHLKDSNHLNLTVSMADAAQARACLNKIVEEMDVQQTPLRQSLLAQKQSQLGALDAQIKLINEHITDMQALTKHHIKDPQFEASIWLITATQTMTEELNQLRKSQADLQLSLLDQNTHGVRLVSPVWVPSEKSGPAIWLVLLVSGLMGWLAEFALRRVIYGSRRC